MKLTGKIIPSPQAKAALLFYLAAHAQGPSGALGSKPSR
jgi:hypothetical protein